MPSMSAVLVYLIELKIKAPTFSFFGFSLPLLASNWNALKTENERNHQKMDVTHVSLTRNLSISEYFINIIPSELNMVH